MQRTLTFLFPLSFLLLFFDAGLAQTATPTQIRSIFENLPPEVRTSYEAHGLRLWSDRAPEAKGVAAGDTPMLYPVLPSKGATPLAAVLVFPGGGYSYLSAQEAFPVAERFRETGLAAFVLQYRLRPYEPTTVALLDAQRAVRLLRARAAEFGIDPARIGAIGFSAGGHLAANLSTHADDGKADAADPVDRQSCRLQSAMLIYPSLVYTNFRRDGAAKMPLPAIFQQPGLHRGVDGRTPPTFMLVGYNDDRTPYEHCLAYSAALREAGVRFELHILGLGGHGFGTRSKDPRLQIWTPLAINWLTTCGFLPEPAGVDKS
jgi:acetyl esterase/lipase